MSTKPLISLTLVVKNGMPFIKDALESVKNQTYKNIELVVQDGLSTDGTLEYIKNFKGIKYIRIRSEKDKNSAEGWNRAIKRCKGEIIGSIDADNIFIETALEKVVSLYKKNRHVGVIYGTAAHINRFGVQRENQQVPRRSLEKFDLLKLLRCELVPPFPSTFLVKKNCRGLLWINDSLNSCGDFDLWLRLSHLPIFAIPQVLSFVRLHNKSSTCNPNNYKRFCKDKIEIVKRFLSRFGQNVLLDSIYKEAVGGIYTWAAVSIYNLEGKTRRFKSFFDLAKKYDPKSERINSLQKRISLESSFRFKVNLIINRFLNHRVVLLLLSSMFISVLTGIISYDIMHGFYKNKPVWVEQAAFSQFPNLIYLDKFQYQGVVKTSLEMFHEERHILQSLALGIINPQLLGWPYAHLLIVLPIFMIFLLFFGWAIYSQSSSLIYSIAALTFFSSLSGLSNERWGIGSGFADYQSFFLMSSALLCLISGLSRPNILWVCLFGILSSLSIMARTTSLFYLLALSTPLLMIYLIRMCHLNLSVQKITKIFISLAISLGPGFIIAFVQLNNLYSYYSSGNTWVLKHGFGESFHNIIYLLTNYIGRSSLVVILIILALKIWSKTKLFSVSDIAILWWFLGFLGLLLSNGYIADMPKEVMYASAPLLLLVFKNISFSKKVSFAIIVLSIITLYSNYSAAKTRVNASSEEETQLRQSQLSMASVLAGIPNINLWQSYSVYDWGIPVSVLTYQNHNQFRRSYNELFHNSQNYWDAKYPGKAIEQIQLEVLGENNKCIDVAIILTDTVNKPYTMEDYSFKIAKYVSQKIKEDDSWQFYTNISGKPYVEKLSVYINMGKNRFKCI